MTAELHTVNGRVPIHPWTVHASPAATRRELLTESAGAAGWILRDGRWPRPRSDGRLVLPEPMPSQFLPIVTAVTAERSALIERLAALDDAWRVVLCDAGARSRARTDQIAAAAGIGRQRLHQIRTERKTGSATDPGRKTVAAVLGRSRAKVSQSANPERGTIGKVRQ